MALSVNRETGIQSNIYTPASSDIVKGDELTRVARELLSSTTPRKTVLNANNKTDVKIFSQGADVNVVKQAATNLTGYNVAVSQNALEVINALKAQAAQAQMQNLTKVVDGKIHINSERADHTEQKSIFANNNLGVEIFQSSSLDKDRKGPGGFYVPLQKEDEEEKSGLNMVI